MGKQIYFTDEELSMLRRCVSDTDPSICKGTDEEIEATNKERKLLESLHTKLYS